MELRYTQTPDGMYILAKDEIEQIATTVLKDCYPQNLEWPRAMNVDHFLTEYLGVLVKERYIGIPGYEALGLTVMKDIALVPSLDSKMNPTVLEETYGNVLISPNLNGPKNIGRKRYTKVHEGAHWILHRPYFEKLTAPESYTGNASASGYIACRSMERCRKSPRQNIDWLEWQADSLAASLLMPRKIFYEFVKYALRKHGAHCGYLVRGHYRDKAIFYDTVGDITSKFSVSSRAVQIRMIHLNLIRSNT